MRQSSLRQKVDLSEKMNHQNKAHFENLDTKRRSQMEGTRSKSVEPSGRNKIIRQRSLRDSSKSVETLWLELQALSPEDLLSTQPLSSVPNATTLSPSYVSPSPRLARAAALRSPGSNRKTGGHVHSWEGDHKEPPFEPIEK